MTVHSRHINGILAFWDTHRKRIVEAIGADVIKYLDDFVVVPGTDATFDPWTVTLVEGGTGESTIAAGNSGNGTMLITTDDQENDGVSAQLNGESFTFSADVPVYFGASIVGINDVDQSDLFIGLAITDTAILGGVTDRIGFESVDGASALDFVVEKDSTETKAAAIGTLVDATAILVEFYWDGSTLEVFVDGASVATPAVTNLPDDEELRVSVEFLTGEGAAQTCEIDWIRCVQFGRS